MQSSHEIRRVFLGILIFLALIGFSALYWAVTGRETLLQREDNPRLIEALARIQRGAIYDRKGRILAETIAAESGLERRYPVPATFSIVGYYSLRFGVGGAEAAYDTALAGSREMSSLADYFNRALLRRPQVGADIMLTLDADLQDSLVAAMDGLWGAAVALDAQNGDILALVSQPSYDPNSLDQDWSALIDQDGDPFFNRALQSQYLPGGSLYLLWLADAFGSGFHVSTPLRSATDAMDLGDGLIVSCVIEAPDSRLTLADALVYGCPAAFDSYRRTGSATAYAKLIAQFAFDKPVILAGFPSPAPAMPAGGNDEADADSLALRRALGQGDLTTTPLHLATIMAAIVNDGEAAAPRLLMADRQPQIAQWTAAQPELADPQPMMEAATAEALRRVLADAWSTLAGQATSPEPAVGAHLAFSQSGEETQLWLNGFVVESSTRKIAYTIVIENLPDLSRMIAIGESLIDALSVRP